MFITGKQDMMCYFTWVVIKTILFHIINSHTFFLAVIFYFISSPLSLGIC